jgi:DNA-binding NarL/FixJ family response regulator
MEQEFLMDINLLLIQIEQLNARVHQLCETYGPRLAHPANASGEVLQLVLEEETQQAPKRKRTKPNHRWTPEEDAIVLALVGRGCKYAEIAQALKLDVSASAVGNRYLAIKGGQS